MHAMKFSLLITVYKGTRTAWLKRCLISVKEQDVQPSEVVIVEDGPISAQLGQLITHWREILSILRVQLPQNLGAGGAAKAGFICCSYPWIARLDADDIAMPTRFSQQLAYLNKHPDIDVLGSHIAEFSDDEQQLQTIRSVPLKHQDIASFMPYRCPINNSSVIFRKHSAKKAGGYEPSLTHEDYFLWFKMLKQGALFANMPEILVKFRMETDTYRRRRGISQVRQELDFQNKLLARGYISMPRYLLNIVLRVSPRLLPTYILKIIYRSFLRHSY